MNLQKPILGQNKIFSLVIVKFAFIKQKEISLMTVHKCSSCVLKRVIHKAVHSCSQIKTKLQPACEIVELTNTINLSQYWVDVCIQCSGKADQAFIL